MPNGWLKGSLAEHKGLNFLTGAGKPKILGFSLLRLGSINLSRNSFDRICIVSIMCIPSRAVNFRPFKERDG